MKLKILCKVYAALNYTYGAKTAIKILEELLKYIIF